MAGKVHETSSEHLGYLVVEGIMGAGKAALAARLAERLNLQPLLEIYEDNPYLERFYRNPARWAFQAQVVFLLGRHRQLSSLHSGDLFHHGVVSDYSIDKDRIIAHLHLSGEDEYLYDQLYSKLEIGAPQPSLVVYLQSSVETCLKRIQDRNQQFERHIDQAFLSRLQVAYSEYFFRYTKSPLLIVNAETVDFVHNDQEFDELVHQIQRGPHHGTTYFKFARPPLFE